MSLGNLFMNCGLFSAKDFFTLNIPLVILAPTTQKPQQMS